MSIKSNAMFKLVFSLALCAFLFAASAADAANDKKAKRSRPDAGSLADLELRIFSGPTTEAYCESGCCWASGSHVTCSESGCYAENEDGSESAEYICRET
jgi:hypothetical protein